MSRSDLPRYEHQRQIYQQKVDVVRQAAVNHDMTQGYVLTQYFYEQMQRFEQDSASLKDTIGEMVYSMDIDQQVHRARQIEFDKEADGDVLRHSRPRGLPGLIWPKPGSPLETWRGPVRWLGRRLEEAPTRSTRRPPEPAPTSSCPGGHHVRPS